MNITFKKLSNENGEENLIFKDAYFNSKTYRVLNNEIKDDLDEAAEDILNKIASWLSEGSGWTIELINSHFINIVSYIPLKGTSHIPLPEKLKILEKV